MAFLVTLKARLEWLHQYELGCKHALLALLHVLACQTRVFLPHANIKFILFFFFSNAIFKHFRRG